MIKDTLLDRTKYRKLMEEFFSQNGEEELQNWKNFIFEKDNDGELELVWGSLLYGRLGAEVRNWMRQQVSWVDEEFKNFGDDWYCEFEDYSWKIFKEVVDCWKSIK